MNLLLQVATSLPAPMAFTLDVAQLVVLGGLIWRLAEMSTAVKNLTTATGALTVAVGDLGTRVTRLEATEDARRDRRRDDDG